MLRAASLAMLSLAMSALLSAQTPPAAPLLCLPPAGHLIRIPADCGEAGRTVPPAELERPVVWVDRDGTWAAGLIGPGETRIEPPAKQGRIELQLSGSRNRGWPAVATVGIRNGKKLVLEARPDFARRLRQIQLPHGRYNLAVTAPRHFPAERNAIAIEAKPVILGTIELEPFPRIMAKVIDSRGEPLAGVVLTDDMASKPLATSDALGIVEYEATAKLPERVALTLPGGPERVLQISSLTTDVDLGTIRLGGQGTLRINVQRPEGPAEALTIRLVRDFRHTRGQEEGREVFKAALDPDRDTVTIPNVDDGLHAIYILGSGPLEQYGEAVTVERGESKKVQIRLDPLELEGVVKLGEEPLAAAELSIGPPTAPGPRWVGKVTTDDRGEFRERTWQRGGMAARIKTAAAGPAMEFFEIPKSGSRHFVEFRIPNSRAIVRVLDDLSSEPLPNVRMQHQFKSEKYNSYHSLRTDERGESEIRPLHPGSHTIRVQHPEYLDAEKTVVTSEAERERLIEVRLTKGVEVHLLVVDSDGRPHPNAEVLQYRGISHAPLRWTSDAMGRVVLRMGPTDRRHLFVIPRQGSFAIVQADSRNGRDPNAPERVVIPRPAGVLRVRTVDRDGKPVHDAILAIRFNGTAIPFQILQGIAHHQGIQFQTGFDGTAAFHNLPPGRYEVWAKGPIRQPTVLEVPAHKVPATVDFLGGEQQLVVTVPE